MIPANILPAWHNSSQPTATIPKKPNPGPHLPSSLNFQHFTKFPNFYITIYTLRRQFSFSSSTDPEDFNGSHRRSDGIWTPSGQNPRGMRGHVVPVTVYRHEDRANASRPSRTFASLKHCQITHLHQKQAVNREDSASATTAERTHSPRRWSPVDTGGTREQFLGGFGRGNKSREDSASATMAQGTHSTTSSPHPTQSCGDERRRPDRRSPLLHGGIRSPTPTGEAHREQMADNGSYGPLTTPGILTGIREHCPTQGQEKN